jgi:hypothetical protein
MPISRDAIWDMTTYVGWQSLTRIELISCVNIHTFNSEFSFCVAHKQSRPATAVAPSIGAELINQMYEQFANKRFSPNDLDQIYILFTNWFPMSIADCAKVNGSLGQVD